MQAANQTQTLPSGCTHILAESVSGRRNIGSWKEGRAMEKGKLAEGLGELGCTCEKNGQGDHLEMVGRYSPPRLWGKVFQTEEHEGQAVLL
jgi:hypothetical protein